VILKNYKTSWTARMVETRDENKITVAESELNKSLGNNIKIGTVRVQSGVS
jgi:hypothetical protein